MYFVVVGNQGAVISCVITALDLGAVGLMLGNVSVCDVGNFVSFFKTISNLRRLKCVKCRGIHNFMDMISMTVIPKLNRKISDELLL